MIMAESDDKSRSRLRRSRLAKAVSASKPVTTKAALSSPASPPSRTLDQAIEAERAQLLQAGAVLVCLYQVLLHAEGEEAVTYAEAAYVAAKLINQSVERLDSVHLRPLIEALKPGPEGPPAAAGKSGFGVREPGILPGGWPQAPGYVCRYIC
jgi:hypothetical protein